MSIARLIAALLLATPAHAASSGAQPYATQGNNNCPSGYYLSGGFCTPTNKDGRPAVPRPPGASCPTGWYASGSGCVKLNKD
jgi:hypothetical protein